MNLIKNQRPAIDKIYFYVKYLFELKFQLLVNGREKFGIKELKNPNGFTDYSQTIGDVYENLEAYYPTKKRKVLILFDDIKADIEANKKLSPIITELLLRGRKLNIVLVFVSKSYFKIPKTKNATHFIMKIPIKKNLPQIESNHLFDIEFKDFMKLFKDYTKETYSFLVKDTTFSSDNPLRFRKNLL